MTYSNSYSSDNTSDSTNTNQTDQTTSSENNVLNSESDYLVNEEYAIAEMAVDMDEIVANVKCLEPYIQQLARPAVDEYDYDYVNHEAPQFEECPETNYAYRQGWNYVDYQPDDDFHGNIASSVLTVRAVPCGPPTTNMGGELYNPGRIQRLPNQTTSYKTMEPKRFLWVHPWLEKGESDQDIISVQLGGETSISLYHSYKHWQSGPVQNGPADEKTYYNAGLETMPGGEASRASNYPTDVLWKTKNGDKRWVFSIGNSRGKEDLAGYDDEKTEGLEYGAIGVHGWFGNLFNNGVKTKSNAGIKFLYLMGRMCTSGDEIKANIEAFTEWIDSINMGFSATIPEFEYETPPELHDIKNWTSDAQGLGISNKDKPKLISLIKYFQKLVDDVKEIVTNNVDDDWDFGACIDRGVFDVTDSRIIKNNQANKTFIDILCELVSEKSYVNIGKRKSEYEYPIDGSTFTERLNSENLSHTDFFNYFFTRKLVANHELAQQIRFDFDIKKIGLYENGMIGEDEIEKELFVLDALGQGNVKNFTYRDNILGVEYQDGFVSNLNYFRNKTDGFCEACERYGGQITAEGNKIYCYDSVKEEIIKIYTGDVIIHDPWTIEEDDIILHRPEALFDYVIDSEDDNVGSYALGIKDFPEIEGNTLQAEGPHIKVPYSRKPSNKLYSKWRGLWCCPTTSAAAPPPWAMYRRNTGNKIHTYGPLTEEEADNIFYMFAGPKDASKKNPRQDYGFTVWWAESYNAPDTNWGQNTKIYPPEANMGSGGSGKNKGWSQFGLGPIRAGSGGAKVRKIFFRVAFWQWVGGRGSKSRGPKVLDSHYPPTNPNYPGHKPGAASPEGVWMDCIMQPATDYSPYDDPENFPPEADESNPVGPAYGTEEIDVTELSVTYYTKPLNTESVTVNKWYEVTHLDNALLHKDLKDKKVPILSLLFMKDINAVNGPTIETDDFIIGAIMPPGTKRYVYAPYENLLFLATESGRTQFEWSPDGETWASLKQVRDSTIKIGPGYWGKPSHNMWDPYFQSPLHSWHPDNYEMDPRNKFIVAGRRYRIKPIRTASFETKEDYEVVFAKYSDALFPYSWQGNESYEELFMSVGELRKDSEGFSFVAPSNVMMFGAFNTIRRKQDWSVLGEEVQILIEEEVGINDNERGPAYWAFDTARNSLGSNGYVDFWDNYWYKPFNHYNKFVSNDKKVKRGETYKISLPATAPYAYRIIWAKSEASTDTSWQKETKIINGNVDRNYPFIYSDDVIYPGAEPREVEALSDYMILGAMRIDNNIEVGGDKYDWSIKGMPALLDFNVEVYDPNAEIEHGPSYWMNANKGMFNTNLYQQPINSVTDDEFIDPDTNGLIRRMVRGEKYKIRTTGATPEGYEYVGVWIDKDGALDTYLVDRDLDLKAGDNNWVYFRAQTERLCFGAYVNGGRTEEDWSPDGEPMFVEVMEDDRPPIGIEGTQYWTDVGGPEENRHWVLKSAHWNDPLKQTKFQGQNTLKPNTTYEITIIDDPQNRDYEHKVWLGEYPNSLNTERDSTYLSGPKLKKGETKTFKTDDINVTLIIGAFETNRELTDWSPDGEPVYINLEELPPLDEEDTFERGPVYYANDTCDNVVTLENKFAYFNPERVYDETTTDTPENIGKRHTKAINTVGTGFDDHPTVKAGQRYRVTPVIPNGVDPYPLFHADDLPYHTRMWWGIGPNALNPEKSEFIYWAAGRAIISKVSYVDFIAATDDLVLGAFNLPNTGNEISPEFAPRDFYEWSPYGEPTHYTIEVLPEVPVSGPLYHQSSKNTLPSIGDAHFYGPINTVKVVYEKKYQIRKEKKKKNGVVEYQIWYVKDEKNDNYNDSKYRKDNGIEIPIDPLYPDDLFVPGENGVVDDGQFYVRGPVLDKNTDTQLFELPKGYSRIFFGEVSRRSITDFSRDGEPFDMGPNTINEGPRDPEFPDPGDPTKPGTGDPPIIIEEYVPNPDIHGPTYWGENESVSGPSFANPHFTDPLNYVAVEGGRTYEVTKTSNDSLDLYNVTIYSFDRNIVPSPLVPKNNKNKINQRFKKLGTFNKNTTRLPIDIPEDHNSVIYSAINIKSGHPSETGGIEAWSTFGEPERVKLDPIAEFKGPVLWADSNNLTEVFAKGFPKFDLASKWSEKFYPKIISANTDYVIKVTESLDFDIDVFMYKDNKGNKAATAEKRFYTKVLTIPKTSRLNEEFYVNSGNNLHIMYGAYNIKPNSTKPGVEKDLAFWSPKGIPAPLTVSIRKWHSGPGYPADSKEAGKWKPDWTNSRWNFPYPSPMTPKGETTFSKNRSYEFKITSRLEYNYQLWWSNSKYPDRSNTTNGGNLIIAGQSRRKFDRTAHGKYAYFAIVNKTGSGNNLGPLTDWSPKGTPCPFKANKNKVEKPDGKPPKPKPWWYYLLLALLLAMLITWLIYASAAPLDVLIEMNEELEHNQYPIRRWKVKTDEDGEEIGYNYPNPTAIDSTAWMDGLDSRPLFINYTADIMVRAWAKLMRIRHNGYMIHGTSRSSTNTSSDWHDKHKLEFFNLTPNYGIGYLRMYNSNMNKVLRLYNPDFPDSERTNNINRFNPYNGKGVQYVILDTRKSKTRNSRDWRDEYKWFEPSLSYCHTTADNAVVKTMGDVAYKLGSTLKSDLTKRVHPTGKIGDAPGPTINNIFTKHGSGFTISHSYSGDTSSHGYHWEICNADMMHKWPNLDVLPYIYPKIEFDLIHVSGSSDQWQFVRFDLNLYEFDDVTNTSIKKRTAIQLYPINSSYVMRDTFENGKPSSHKLGQIKDGVHQFTLVSDSPILQGQCFASLSMAVWIGGGGNKYIRIANLRADGSFDPYN